MTVLTALSRAAALALAMLGAAAHAQTLPELTDEDRARLETSGYALGDMVIGSPDAPIEIIEYSSLVCPVCGRFHNEYWPEIKRQYVDTGRVRLVFRDIITSQEGLWAATLVRCGGEDAFAESLFIFMSRQAGFLDTVQRGASGEAVQRMGQFIGLSPQRQEQCLTDQPFALRVVEDFSRNSAELIESQRASGLPRPTSLSTPSFVINGDAVRGITTLDDFIEMIEARL